MDVNVDVDVDPNLDMDDIGVVVVVGMENAWIVLVGMVARSVRRIIGLMIVESFLAYYSLLFVFKFDIFYSHVVNLT